ncbi:MAG TPA: NAD(P)H-quinone oxidoreductase [Actinomycetaceae bacterium]|nr:NAD(P)H-quinone oxidoreductase [Actinomycetaceae bacterium]
MRAITVTPAQTLELSEVPAPVAGPGEVLLDVVAAGVNRADVLQRQGHYTPPPGASETIGLEVSGTVREVGAAVEGWRPGDEACALLAGGGYAEQVVVPAGQLLPIPAGISLVDAAALPEAACTAWPNLVDVGDLRPGETALIHGGSGGVGSMAIQLARALGARVVATAGGPERTARCRELGADVVVDHRSDVPAAVLEATDGRGVDVILDLLGAGGLDDNTRMLAIGGRLVVIGLQRGRRGELDLARLMAKQASIHGTLLRPRPVEQKAAIVAQVRERVWPMVDDGRVRAVVHDRIPLGEAQRAHELLDSGTVFGKLLLVV